MEGMNYQAYQCPLETMVQLMEAQGHHYPYQHPHQFQSSAQNSIILCPVQGVNILSVEKRELQVAS